MAVFALAIAFFMALPVSVLVGMAVEKNTEPNSPVPGLVMILFFGVMCLALGAYLI